MSLKCAFQSHTLQFKFEAGTSRGKLSQKKIWILKIWDTDSPDVYGLGEIAPLKGLSPDAETNYDEVLDILEKDFGRKGVPPSEDKCLHLAESLAGPARPSLRFGIETALLDLWMGGRRILFNSGFTAGREDIPINGLIWMGDESFMREQVSHKIAEGYTCIKMKIGAIDFDTELAILGSLRETVVNVIRVDANGAFTPENVMEKLERLGAYGLHSIEQPVAAGQFDLMRAVCQHSPVPVALDEELIGVEHEDRGSLLDRLKPQYIILKPTLLGGIAVTREWIAEAEQRGIGWWMTSALESNIGLNAITQLTAVSNYTGHQGLGTGGLYYNNFQSPMEIRKGFMHYNPDGLWEFNDLAIC